MEWFSGDIASAITKCRADQSVLLVYVKGNDENSKKMDEIWISTSVGDFFKQRDCVPLCLDIASVGGQQFSQIYPVLAIPSTFLIQSNGVPVEIIPFSSAQELCEKASTHLKQRSSQEETESSIPANSHVTPSVPCTESQGSDNRPSSYQEHIQESDEASQSAESDETVQPRGNLSEEEFQAKLNRAKELLRMKQQQKEEEEKEKAKNAELERRKFGKEIKKLKDFKAESEIKETRDALKKEKRETEIAREKIREQIQKDREARKAKYEQEKVEQQEALRLKQQEKLRQEAENAAKLAAERSSVARLQFRMPDGSTINHTLDAEETLQNARDVVLRHPLNSVGPDFRLATIYPRRVFTSAENHSTVRELGLVPSSVLMVLPPASEGDVGTVHHGSESNSFGSIYLLLSLLFSPVLAVWRYLSAFLSRGNASQQSSASSSSSPDSAGARPNASSEQTGRKRIGRLSDLPRGDDDQNTWNGNSTQQK